MRSSGKVKLAEHGLELFKVANFKITDLSWLKMKRKIIFQFQQEYHLSDKLISVFKDKI